MPEFTVRVELSDPENADYVLLTQKMVKEGFKKEIDGFKGKYVLPLAEFNYHTETKDHKEVIELAFSIAEKITLNPAILVTEVKNRAWKGLERL
ncbi:hypothetical protein ACNARU_09690 [Proteus sp. WDL240414]|uniref:DUF2622 domain-containing protein n=2 Tax=Proteus TaxID=583 RepID=A0A6I7DDZ0_9GAMM|nr:MULTISPECIES: hypothetical protein [Proteus]MBG2803233.1 hypothetical protein [Proteus mirabilis]MBG3021365.1 hypothetical protein [Proteus mirabilis]MBG3153088.1 hypothetical protein [Proteus mirabilis]QHN11077.1 hypothetical protein F1325_11635 [Proteus columbae]